MAERPHLAFPVQLSSSGQLLVNEQGSDEEVEDCIAVILTWPQGTREGFETFGTPPQLFASGGPDLAEIRDAVVEDEPRAADVRDELIRRSIRKGVGEVIVGFDQRGGE